MTSGERADERRVESDTHRDEKTSLKTKRLSHAARVHGFGEGNYSFFAILSFNIFTAAAYPSFESFLLRES